MGDTIKAIIPVLGAVIGAFYGGPQGAQAGFAIGVAVVGVATAAGIGVEDNVGSVAGLEDSRDQGLYVNAQSTVEPINVIYGRARIAGTRCYVSVTGNDNRFLHQIFVWCEGEINAVEQILLDDKDGPAHGGITYEETHVLGTEDQGVVLGLGIRDPAWTGAHRLRGVAYTYLQLEWNDTNLKYEHGVPTVTAIIQGKKVFDPRDSVIKYSDNPSLCIWDFITNARYGRGIDTSSLDSQSFEDAADFCDELVTIPDGAGGETTQKRYTCNGVLRTTSTALANLRALLVGCRGILVFVGGKYKLKIDKVETPTFTLDQSNILGKWSIDIGNKSNRINRLKTRFFDADIEFKPTYHVVDAFAFRTQDAEFLLERERLLPFTNNIYMAEHLAFIEMKASRQPITVSLTASMEVLELEVGEVVKITHPTPGWTDKLFRVRDMELQSSHEIKLILIEFEASTYDLQTLEDADTTPDTNLPDTQNISPPSNVDAHSGDDHSLFVQKDGTISSNIHLTWDTAPDAFVSVYEIQFKRSVDSIWVNSPNIDGLQTEAFLERVEDGVAYDIRIRSVNFSGIQSLWITVTSHVVVGKTDPPPDVTTFTILRQPDGTRQFDWLLVSPPKDLKGYHIRFKAGTGATWSTMAALHDGILVSSPYESNQLAAGTYTFGIKAIDTSDNESTNALIIETTLDDPRIAGAFSVIDFHKDGWPTTRTDSSIARADVDAVTNDLVAGSLTDWANLPSTWDAWTAWNDNSPELTYEYQSGEIDLGGDVVFEPLTSVTVINGSAAITYKYKIDGGSFQGSWQTVTAPITAKVIKIRILVTTSPTSANDSRLTSGLFIASGKIIDEDINDLDMTDATFQASAHYLAVGDIRLPITKTYSVISGVSITLQSVGPGYSWELIDKNVTLGPRVKIYDETDTLKDVTIDGFVRGLG